MPEKYLYEYAVVRILPRIEREEFINAGVILFCKKKNYLKIKYEINEHKLMVLSPDVDSRSFQKILNGFEKISLGSMDGGCIAQLDIPERFRWLTAIRSTTLQTSRPHSGFTSDLDKTLHELFMEFVL